MYLGYIVSCLNFSFLYMTVFEGFMNKMNNIIHIFINTCIKLKIWKGSHEFFLYGYKIKSIWFAEHKKIGLGPITLTQ